MTWDAATTFAALQAVAQETGQPLREIVQPVRIALTGTTISEPIGDLLEVMGRERVLRKLDAYLDTHR